ncbi:TPA: hypothetical protein N0F65_011859 [Lagenidium giganteum]|uniref:Tubulin-tyrosine ligase n=1 Tax=Lagenidium giganteum TaxID=4803 RepID=A0AAV2YLZ4_9STRA|nr:TPA: hypothetical protein N0F65_011859 [Lagenidium giganteum]
MEFAPRVFVTEDKYEDVILALQARGWTRFAQASFPRFELKWARYAHIAWDNVLPTQRVNHLRNAVVFSQKDLLAKALYAFDATADTRTVDTFFPRAFVTSDTHHVELLRQWFAYCDALRILKATGVPDNDTSVVDALKLLSTFDHWLGCGDLTTTSRSAALDLLQARDPQFHAVADCNVWICKPARLSRGRGIQLLRTEAELDAFLADYAADTPWVVQKYIESPFLGFQRGRKFDVRQWVLIKSLEPLQVLWYRRCYLRFCTEKFTLNQLDAPFVHLSNYSVQKHAACIDDTDDFSMMWSSDRSKVELEKLYGRNVWESEIVPRMKSATKTTILAVAPQLQTVGRGFEWLGLDFVIDGLLQPWLLEVNVSPDVSRSTPVTAELVPLATEDAFKSKTIGCIALF